MEKNMNINTHTHTHIHTHIYMIESLGCIQHCKLKISKTYNTVKLLYCMWLPLYVLYVASTYCMCIVCGFHYISMRSAAL